MMDHEELVYSIVDIYHQIEEDYLIEEMCGGDTRLVDKLRTITKNLKTILTDELGEDWE